MVSSRRSVVAATAVSVVLTSILFIGGRIVPMEALRMSVFERTGMWLWDNPFRNLYILVGFLGGAIAGYLSNSRWQEGGVDGFWVGLLTGVTIYLILVAYNIFSAFMAGGPIAFYVIAVVPLIYTLPILFVFPLEGGLAGMIVAWFRNA